MKELEYPLDIDYILKNKRHIKKELLNNNFSVEKRIAILGGSTTSDVKNMLEIFLLNYGIKAEFYESEYNKFYEDAVFANEELTRFNPDIIYVHTTVRNIRAFPNITDTEEEINVKLNSEINCFYEVWNGLKKYNAIIIQNNFEHPSYRLLGNREVIDIHGKINFINRLNSLLVNYANENKNFYINDINYVSSCFGLDNWFNEAFYHMYKYAMDMRAIPYLSYNLSHIIKALYGKNKKGLVLDMDNTLWGGVIGDDGIEGIKIGSETPDGEVFYAFQKYLLEQSTIGNILMVSSKNEEENALAGLNHPSSVLRPDDFTIIKANWNPKSDNIRIIADTLDLGADSFVFVDDNPAERKIVSDSINGIAVPDIKNPEDYIRILDRNGYFEVISLSQEDLNKKDIYKSNAERKSLMNESSNYEDYLRELKMHAEISEFKDIYLDRITQLIGKSNQFNLTTRRYTLNEIEEISKSDEYIKIYGKLSDIFGDNGLISVVIGKVDGSNLHIDLWLMSCRVLKRNMEQAMLDELVNIAMSKGIEKIYGYYYPTAKNKMVENFYEEMKFTLIEEDDTHKKYELNVSVYEKQNNIIEVN